YDVSKTTSLDSFSDAGSVSNYAVESMKWAVANGLIAGNGNGILDPKGSATRAQVAAILTRFDELFSEK
ncbi:MAG: S-layer homology domain-containing protein, partial [Oscillospiraceae bacterium]